MKKALLVAAILLAGGSVYAETNIDYQSQYDQCVDRITAPYNGAIAACARSVDALVSEDLNNTYENIYNFYANDNNPYSPDTARLLKASQVAYLDYRSKMCQFRNRIGAMPMDVICPMEMNIRRLRELQEYKLGQ